ncbi:MAG: ABC transporter permease [Rhodospirillales bacterium]|jgi:peptide/nickel transport system permease protein|nr:ABC transporter permease [Rhodospirillales bacterium]
MSVFIIRRLMQSVVVVFVMTLIVFFGVMVIGNPVDILIGQDCDGPCREQVIRALGLHLPLHEQYFVFVKNALKGELGVSFRAGIPAIHLIFERMPATMELAFSAMFMAIVIGIPLGMWAGLKPNSVSGKLIMGGSILGFSLPSFWVGLMFIMIFAVALDWLPATGRGDTIPVLGLQLSLFTLDGLSHLILPAINLALFKMSLVIRLTRAGMREALFMDYVKFAYAKGLGQRRVVLVHVLKNILIPVVTVLGLELGNVIAFSVVTETVFSWPGMGKLIIDSIDVLDRPVVVAYLMITVFMFIFINLVVDIFYSMLDPRVRLQGAER